MRHAGILCLRMRKAVPSAIWPIGLAGWYRASDVPKGCSHTVRSLQHLVPYSGNCGYIRNRDVFSCLVGVSKMSAQSAATCI